jgi:hypothetical protein
MSDSQQARPAAEEPAINPDDDPEIAALLEFEPVPRKLNRRDGWTPDLQRRFVRLIVETGTPQRAAAAISKRLCGIEAVYRDDEKGEFRAAFDRAVELGRERQLREVNSETEARLRGGIAVPAHRRLETPVHDDTPGAPLPGQLLNEYGEYEDSESIAARAEEAKQSIATKLIRIRRAYLQEISHSAGKRAAFEILTELPVDWELAKRMEPQPFEPWTRTNQRQPDMILTAESGWSMGEIGYGPDKIAQLRASIDEHRASEGLEPVDWESDSTGGCDANSPSPPSGGEGRERGPR